MRTPVKKILLLIYFFLFAELCVAAEVAGYKSPLKPEYIEENINPVTGTMRMEGRDIVYGDPGWIKKMTRRRELRLQAARGEAVLQALQADNFYLPVLLGSFSDRKGSYSVADFQNRFFDNNSSGTITDYFDEVSYGQFKLTGSVFGWFQVDNPSDYYSSNFMDMNAFPTNSTGFVVDVITGADPSVDFSRYDNDGPDGIPDSGDDDGYVDAVTIVVASSSRDGEHVYKLAKSFYYNLGNHEYTTDDPSSIGGNIKVNAFTMVDEMDSFPDSIGISSIGTACHEFCHVLFLSNDGDWKMVFNGSRVPSGAGE